MLFKLLFAPVTGPPAGLRALLGQLRSLAERELYDLDKLHDDLILLQLRLEEGEIGELEYQDQEAVLLARIRAVKEYQLEQSGQ